MSAIIAFLEPYEFSPTVLGACLIAAVVYGRGLIRMRRAGEPAGFWRSTAFFLGLGLMYLVMQSRIDYISQHMFWVHRAQHLVLHHLGPFLVVLAAPQAIMARGLPRSWIDRLLSPVWQSGPTQWAYRFVQYPVIAATLFVGLIYFWLTPSIHFDAMLSLQRYQIMNWSMAIDGLLFWWLIVNPKPRGHGGLGHGSRIIMLWAITIPQIILGAHIALSKSVLYDVYNVCGRAWPISPIVDQELGGLITWIPTSMMSAVAAMVVLRLWVRDNSRQNSESQAALTNASTN
jgi:putative membrane protein